MGLFDIVSSILSSAAKSTAQQRAKASRDFERKNPNMYSAQRERLGKFNIVTEKMAEYGRTSVNTSGSNSANRSVGGYGSKSVSEWDCEWQSIGRLKDANLTPYNNCVGLYRYVVNGKTKYVGRAIELNNGGFRKRLSDYRRESNSARKHSSGRIIHEHLDEIITYILIVGYTQEAVEITKKLEGEFVRKYNPEWNKQINI